MRRALYVAAAFVLAVVIALAVMLLLRRPHRRVVVERPPAPAPLPQSLRAALRPRMQRHAAQMQALTDAVVMMDNPRVAQLARALVDDLQLASLKDVPPGYRELEQAFADRAKALAGAAAAGDDDAVAARHAEVAIVCARCHTSFR